MSKFTRFNRKQLFNFDTNLIARNEITDAPIYLGAKDIYERDGERSEPHLLVGFWKNETSEENKQKFSTLPDYTYVCAVKLGDEYFYVNAPAHMNKDFDDIASDLSLVREINEGHCAICAYQYEKTIKYGKDKEVKTCYGLEFC